MTLILTVNGHESIWLLADRRLSYKGHAPKDDARKVMFLDVNEDTAILGYAGLGATALGTEPADWMSAVLRGQNLPLEQSLGVLADAIKRQLPRHLINMPKDSLAAHNVVITAFLDNEAKLYTIDLVFAPDRKSYQFRYTRWQANNSDSTSARTPRFGLGGSGGMYLHRDRRWTRKLLYLVNANDKRKVSDNVVADYLASLNYKVHLTLRDKSVGPRCIVAWRHRREGIHKGGGGQQFYTGTERDNNSPLLPAIGNGMDIEAIARIIMPDFSETLASMQTGEPPKELDKDQLNAKLARLPQEPDENLR